MRKPAYRVIHLKSAWPNTDPLVIFIFEHFCLESSLSNPSTRLPNVFFKIFPISTALLRPRSRKSILCLKILPIINWTPMLSRMIFSNNFLTIPRREIVPRIILWTNSKVNLNNLKIIFCNM